MAGRTDSLYRYRSGRSRSRRDVEQNDTIVVALTLQIVVCIVLLLSANIAKRVDETAYGSFQQQYAAMTTDTGQNSRLSQFWAEVTGGEGLFTGLENLIGGLVDSFGGGSAAPVEETPTPREEEAAQDSQVFRYNYLQPEVEAVGGAGGLNPVETTATTGLPAPEGSTLAPVFLVGRAKPPVTGRITSPFAYRYHPISGQTDFHTGMDIAAEEGRAVLAALPGEVVEVGENDIYGKYIVIQHATHLQTFYAHCSEIIGEEGMAVRQGERIARVGQTGTATGPHLHFSVIVDGQYTDPYWILEDNIQVVE